MKKRLVLIVLACLLVIIDNSFSPFIAIKGAWPSFLFAFAVAYSLLNGPKEGMIIGLISGVFQDFFFCGIFGVNSLINMIFCYIIGYAGEGVWRDKRLVPVISVFILTILKYIGVFIIFYLLKIEMDVFRGIFVAIYNSIIMLFSYSIIFKYFKREDMRRTWRF